MPRLQGRKRDSQPCSVGFTLVELLVVVAVLAIIAAILIPMLCRVRELAYRTECASNLRQLGQAFAQYSTDWNGFWPSPGGLVGDRGYWSQSGNGGLYPYVKQRGLRSVWCCPLLTEWGGQFPPRSYSMNSYLRTPADAEYWTCTSILRGIHVQAIRQPQRTILLYEGIPRTREFEDVAYSEDQIFYIYRCANWAWARGYYDKILHTIEPGKPWHGSVSNYLYADCHIVARPPGRKTVGTLSTHREMYEWYVDKARFEIKVWPIFSGMGAPYE